MDYFQVIILSLVEGVTEFLPISSTGHLILVSNILGIAQTEFLKSFEIIIQLGAILAVVSLYWKTLTTNILVWKKIMVAFIPTVIVGLAFYRMIKEVFLERTEITLFALFFGGVLLIILEKLYKEQAHHIDSIEKLSIKKAFLIGLVQSLSIIPGVSRAAATIFGGLFIGLKRKAAVEFSFLLAVPTMAAATALDIVKTSFSFSIYEWSLLVIGFIGAFVTALITVKYFIQFIQKHTFIPFGVYRIILSFLFWMLFIK